MFQSIKILWFLSLFVTVFASYPSASPYQGQLVEDFSGNYTDIEKASEKLVDLGAYVGDHQLPPKVVRITNTVAVKVPTPYPVHIPHHIPVPIPVNKPYPVPVTKYVTVPAPTVYTPATSPTLQPASSTAPSGTETTYYDNSIASESQHSPQHHHYQNEHMHYVNTHPYSTSIFDSTPEYNPQQFAAASQLMNTRYQYQPQQSPFSYQPQNPSYTPSQQYYYQQAAASQPHGFSYPEYNPSAYQTHQYTQSPNYQLIQPAYVNGALRTQIDYKSFHPVKHYPQPQPQPQYQQQQEQQPSISPNSIEQSSSPSPAPQQLFFPAADATGQHSFNYESQYKAQEQAAELAHSGSEINSNYKLSTPKKYD